LMVFSVNSQEPEYTTCPHPLQMTSFVARSE
jgi:hypothetical protein